MNYTEKLWDILLCFPMPDYGARKPTWRSRVWWLANIGLIWRHMKTLYWIYNGGCEICRAVTSLAVLGGQESTFLMFSSNFEQFFLLFLKLYLFSSPFWPSGWASRPPGKALTTPLAENSSVKDSVWFDRKINHWLDSFWMQCAIIDHFRIVSIRPGWAHSQRRVGVNITIPSIDRHVNERGLAQFS